MLKKNLLLIPLLAIAVVLAVALTTLRDAPRAVASAEAASATAAEPQVTDAIRLVVAPTGNEARYRVREQLVGRDLPNDAVGSTREVSGAIAISSEGTLIPSQSKIVVDMSQLTSDEERRDRYVRRNVLETEQYPTIELTPTALRGLSGPLPTSGTRTFDLVGDLTVRGVSRPTVWRVAAEFQGTRITGTAATAFTFAEFGLTQPRVPILLSVADSIRLEYDFTLDRESPATR